MKTTRQFFKPLLFVCYLVLTSWSFNGQIQLITPDGINGNWWPGSAMHSIDNSGLLGGPAPTTWSQAQSITHISPATIHTATYSLDHNNFDPFITYTFNTPQNIDGMVLWQPCGAHIGGDAPINIIEIISEKCGITTRDTIVTGLPSVYAKKFNFTPKYGITSITLNILETWVDDDVNATSCDGNSTWTSTDINSTFDILYNYSLGEIKFTEAKFTSDVDCEAGAYCCPGENLVENGNFEYGNIGFTSAYTQTSATYPGEYNVTSNANAFGATVNDHSNCVDPAQYPNNSFLVVNGKTQKNGSSVIWAQRITGLEKGKEYKFCANFKDMEQCTFNIPPNITISAGSFSSSQVINTDDNDPCDWQKVEICFTATSSRINLRIVLDETGNGDGNDLAIDDIALQQKLDPNYFITVQHQGNNNDITGSLNTISNGDDTLLNEDCDFEEGPYPYYWFVYEPLDPTAPLNVGIKPLTFGWANATHSGGDVIPAVIAPWNLTTTFTNYPFANNKFYVIGMYIPSCCESCYTESWEYQITYNNGFAPSNADDFSDEMKEDIKRRFVKSKETTLGIDEIKNEKEFILYPNPAQDSFNISLLGDSLKSVEVYSLTGQTIISRTFNEGKTEETIDISSLATGMYFVRVTGVNQKQYTANVIKE